MCSECFVDMDGVDSQRADSESVSVDTPHVYYDYIEKISCMVSCF